jgi:hypothetical protein
MKLESHPQFARLTGSITYISWGQRVNDTRAAAVKGDRRSLFFKSTNRGACDKSTRSAGLETDTLSQRVSRDARTALERLSKRILRAASRSFLYIYTHVCVDDVFREKSRDYKRCNIKAKKV